MALIGKYTRKLPDSSQSTINFFYFGYTLSENSQWQKYMIVKCIKYIEATRTQEEYWTK